jgi:hypothetical protein
MANVVLVLIRYTLYLQQVAGQIIHQPSLLCQGQDQRWI